MPPQGVSCERSLHITYDVEDHENRWAIRDALMSLVLKVNAEERTEIGELQILDCGCGVGLLMRDLKARGYSVKGVDIDPRCVNTAKQFGECLVGDVYQLENLYGRKEFDIVILSHVLEHIERPTEVLQIIRSMTRRWVILAVPNPLRPRIQAKYTMRRRDYSNKGHFYSWDRSHFANFLELHNQLRIVEWATDRVRLFPFLRKLMRRISALDRLETTVFSKWMPYYSDSLIVLCELAESGAEKDVLGLA